MGWHRPKYAKTRWNDALSRTSWQDFEHLIADYYARQGFRVEHVGTGNKAFHTDGGIDLKLYRANEYIVVQCKHWNAEQITHNPVHELIGVMHTQGATRAIIVTSGEFTRAAREAASRVSTIELVDGQGVREMLGPVPEPATPYFDFGHAPSWAASAANGPVGYHAKRYVTRHAKIGVNLFLTRLMLGAAGALLFPVIIYLVYMAAWNNMSRRIIEATQRTPPIRQAPKAAALAPVGGGYRVSYRAQGALPQQQDGRDGGPPVAAITRPENTQEMKEWARQNAESMKILEKTTPEL